MNRTPPFVRIPVKRLPYSRGKVHPSLPLVFISVARRGFPYRKRQSARIPLLSNALKMWALSVHPPSGAYGNELMEKFTVMLCSSPASFNTSLEIVGLGHALACCLSHTTVCSHGCQVYTQGGQSAPCLVGESTRWSWPFLLAYMLFTGLEGKNKCPSSLMIGLSPPPIRPGSFLVMAAVAVMKPR